MIGIAFAVLAQVQAPIAPLSAEIAAELKARIAQARGGVVVVGRRAGDAVRFDVVRGDDTVRADENTPFEVGSISKTVTGALLADAIRRGEVRADEAIDDVLPAGVKAPAHDGKRITFGDLATQRSGLPSLPANLDPLAPQPYADYDRAKLYAFLGGYTLTRDPGAQAEYSNLGFGLLGTLLADRAKEPYAQLARERIFGPLGMTATTASNDDAGLLPGHDVDGADAPHWHFDALAGAGAVRSTARDMLRYAGASFDGAAGAAARDDVLDAQRPRLDATAIGGPGARIGYAWITMGDGVVWHNGGTAGFRAYLGVLPHQRAAVVLLTNVFANVDDVGAHLLDPAVAMATTERQVAVDPAVLTRYVGRYAIAPGVVVDVTRDDRGLAAQLTGQPKYGLYASSPTSFFWRVVPARIDFAVDASGRVTGATLHQNGRDLPLTRQP